MARTISNHDDIIDSRDVIARIAEIEDMTEECEHCAGAGQIEDEDTGLDTQCAECDGNGTRASRDLDEDLEAEYDALVALQTDAEGYAADWRHGEALIRDSYFEDYARELASDIGAISDDAKWPCTCIDWARAARELQQDYTSVEFDGVTYWIR